LAITQKGDISPLFSALLSTPAEALCFLLGDRALRRHGVTFIFNLMLLELQNN
jgi:hypothetical protein